MIAITISIWFSWFYFFQILQYFVTTTTTQSYQTSKCETASKEVFQSILFINSGFKWWVWMYLKVHFRIRFFWNSNSCKNLLTYLLREKITVINFKYLSKNQIFYTRPISILAHFVAIQKRKLKLQPHLILTN